MGMTRNAGVGGGGEGGRGAGGEGGGNVFSNEDAAGTHMPQTRMHASFLMSSQLRDAEAGNRRGGGGKGVGGAWTDCFRRAPSAASASPPHFQSVQGRNPRYQHKLYKTLKPLQHSIVRREKGRLLNFPQAPQAGSHPRDGNSYSATGM